MLLNGFSIDPARAGERAERLPFPRPRQNQRGAEKPAHFADWRKRAPAKPPCWKRSPPAAAYAPAAAAATRSMRTNARPRPCPAPCRCSSPPRAKGIFIRADRFAELMATTGRLPMATTGEWRVPEEQSRGEGVLSLLTARVDASEGMLYILDEPETGLSPQRQMALLCLLDDVFRDGRSQALVATPLPHSHEPPRLRPALDRPGRHHPTPPGRHPPLARHAPLHARPGRVCTAAAGVKRRRKVGLGFQGSLAAPVQFAAQLFEKHCLNSAAYPGVRDPEGSRHLYWGKSGRMRATGVT